MVYMVLAVLLFCFSLSPSSRDFLGQLKKSVADQRILIFCVVFFPAESIPIQQDAVQLVNKYRLIRESVVLATGIGWRMPPLETALTVTRSPSEKYSCSTKSLVNETRAPNELPAWPFV